MPPIEPLYLLKGERDRRGGGVREKPFQTNMLPVVSDGTLFPEAGGPVFRIADAIQHLQDFKIAEHAYIVRNVNPVHLVGLADRMDIGHITFAYGISQIPLH